jgi:hypothetical protein
VHALSEELRAASDASATAEWAATTDAKGGVWALSEAFSAANEATATAAWADAADAEGGVRLLSEAPRTASQARATAARAAAAITMGWRACTERSAERSKRSESFKCMGCRRHCKRGGVRALRKASSAASKASAAAAWAATDIAETRRAVAKRSAEHSEWSECYSRMSCRR